VIERFGLGELGACHRIERGFVDENWKLETGRGRYFVKRRHPRRRQPRRIIRAQHDLMAHLRRHGFPAPALVATEQGQTLLVLDGEYYEVEEYVDGEPYDQHRPEHLEAAARLLGRYHTLVEGFAPPALQEAGNRYSPVQVSDHLRDLQRAWHLDPEADLGALYRLQAALTGHWAGHGPLPYLVNHGDYYAGNLLFDSDRVVGLVDYDKASWQPRVAELAEALIFFATLRPGHLRHLVYPGYMDWGPLSRFLQGYGREIALTESEALALPDFVCCIWFAVSLQRLLEGQPTEPPPEARAALAEVADLVSWALDSRQEMVRLAQTAREEEALL
jgi:Ser/Thr protein kinase RdoA (MazF antagonist)